MESQFRDAGLVTLFYRGRRIGLYRARLEDTGQLILQHGAISFPVDASLSVVIEGTLTDARVIRNGKDGMWLVLGAPAVLSRGARAEAAPDGEETRQEAARAPLPPAKRGGGIDHRYGPRIPINARVRLYLDGVPVAIGTAGNLNPHGLFVAVRDVFSCGTYLEAEVLHGGLTGRRIGVMVIHRSAAGIGLIFCRRDPEVFDFIYHAGQPEEEDFKRRLNIA